jgi:mRNA interferase HigB
MPNGRTSPLFKETFSTADTGKRTGKVIFDIAGNKYRLIAVVNFERQSVLIDQVFTHEEYDREVL